MSVLVARFFPLWTAFPDTNPVRQHLRAVNLRKAHAIKAEIEKLLKDGFIYPVPLMEWFQIPF